MNGLKQLAKIQGQLKKAVVAYERRVSEIERKKKGVLAKMEGRRRVTEATDLTIQLRKKVLEIDEIKAIMDKHSIKVEGVALVEERGEEITYHGDTIDHPQYVMVSGHNVCSLGRSYIYGGPDDQFKVLFRNCHNGRYVLTGFVFNPKFPMTRKAKPKGNQKLSKKDFGMMMGFRRPV